MVSDRNRGIVELQIAPKLTHHCYRLSPGRSTSTPRNGGGHKGATGGWFVLDEWPTLNWNGRRYSLEYEDQWGRVKHPYGATLKIILDGIDFSAPLPTWIQALGYGKAATRLVHVCIALQCHEGDEPFFISARQAGELIGMHYTDASKVFTTLVADGVLSLVSRGSGTRASRYFYVERQ